MWYWRHLVFRREWQLLQGMLTFSLQNQRSGMNRKVKWLSGAYLSLHKNIELLWIALLQCTVTPIFSQRAGILRLCRGRECLKGCDPSSGFLVDVTPSPKHRIDVCLYTLVNCGYSRIRKCFHTKGVQYLTISSVEGSRQ